MCFKLALNKEEINNSVYYVLGLNIKSNYIYDITKDLKSFKSYFSNTQIIKHKEAGKTKISNDLEFSSLSIILEFIESIDFYKSYRENNIIFKNINISFFLSLVNNRKIFSFFIIKEMDLTFCLIQGFSNFAVWIPSSNVYIPISEVDSEVHNSVISKFLNTLFESLSLINDMNSINEISDIKVLLAYARPYHFFMDFLRSYFSMKSANIISNEILYLEKESFFGAEDDPNKELVLSETTSLNKYLLSNNCLLLYPVRNYVNKNNTIDDYYRWVIKKSSMQHDNNLGLKPNHFVLWIGICAEKRSWLEMEDGVKAIIENFSRRKDELCVVLDGLTRQEFISKDSFIENIGSKDFELAELITKTYPNISFINSVGFTAKEKIYLAQKVDFFVTNFLTDSMYVARFAKKLGVAYGANVSTFKDHKHPKTFILPTKYVKDLESNDSVNWAKVGYSIDPESIASFCQKVEEGYKNRKAIEKIFTGKDFSIDFIHDEGCFRIEPSKGVSTYVGINEEFYGFSRSKNSAYSIEKNEKYHFRYEALSKKSSLLYIIAYINNERVFTERIKPDSSKSFIFPKEADKFRLFIRLNEGDVLNLYNIFWNTRVSSNCAWLSVQ